nr:MAG TPA: hypothetical protein [Caudoviricetes sp.]
MLRRIRDNARTLRPTEKEVIRMYEYEVVNRKTGEIKNIYGYNVSDAFSRLAHLEEFAASTDWIVTFGTYID